MKLRLVILAVSSIWLIFVGCSKESVPVPYSQATSAFLKGTISLSASAMSSMDGVYQVTSGSDKFGDFVIVKSNRTGMLIANSNGKYFILETGHIDSNVYLGGYWRDGYADATGLCTILIKGNEGGASIISGEHTEKIIMRGNYGQDSKDPDKDITLQYLRPFSDRVKSSDFYILAHRSGGRNSDRLPVSENSLAMVKYTEKLGTTGIEVDPRVSSDGVPFVYHDPDINTRLTQKGPLAGDISKYTWRELSTLIRLIHGEKIPSVEQLLTYAIDSTQLRFVYLDMKDAAAVAPVAPIQQRAIEHAQAIGRDVLIVIGIPTTDVLNAILALPNYKQVPTLCELTVDEVRQVNARVWAPRWTLGTQNELVQEIHNDGRLAITWTIDSPNWIETFLSEGHFDGLLTNYPYVEAYYHYIQ